ncbi:MAG TPA: zinc-ribbon domain-containing protein [Polyangiaceae bacterium]|nr:zinc-ribbon domain-containing protein [Polyangiaceae bacterium]
MDVCCTRCGTEYEFDDALISERGTNVRCTQCGFQFKVYPPKQVVIGPDEWVVLTGLGRRIVYRSLRELQNGIVQCEVAREDLLARGSKPPRPLGSIAELDPLFVVKSGPERQPSTLTGVAPPAVPAAPKESPGHPQAIRAGEVHEGAAAVVPNPNAASDAIAVLPAPIAVAERDRSTRGERSGTVLGIGAKVEPTVQQAPKLWAPGSAEFSVVPNTRAYGVKEAGGQVSTAPTVTAAGIQAPPPPTLDTTAQLNFVAEAAPLGMFQSEPEPELQALKRDVADLQPEPARAEHMLPPPLEAESVAAESQPPTLAEVPLARVQLQHKLVSLGSQEEESKLEIASASEPPPAQGDSEAPARQLGESRVEPTPGEYNRSSPSSEPDVNSTRLLEPRISMFAKPQADGAGKEVAKPPTQQVPARSANDDATAPAARVRPKAVGASTSRTKAAIEKRSAESKSSQGSGWVGRAALTVVLLGLGLFAGTKIVGSHLQRSQRPPERSKPTASVDVSLQSWKPAVDDALARGDEAGAREALAKVPAESQSALAYRQLSARGIAQSCDLAWWKVQLLGKGAGDAYSQAKQRLSECLERLLPALVAAGSIADWPEPVHAAALDARRMQGDRSEPSDPNLVDRLRQATSPELVYTRSMLSWVKAGVPDDATVATLQQVRYKPIDLGSHAVALVVALTQLNRSADAKQELKALQSQSPPHPLANEMAGYVTNAERALANAPDAGAKLVPEAAGSAERPETEDGTDPDLAGDFRVRLTRASECLARNELTRAQKLLRSVLAQRPNDTEAITALGDVFRRRGDLAQARKMYDKALTLNGNYLPAMSGAAEVRWNSGDRAGAVSWYRRIVERVGETPGYGQLAATRIKDFESAAKPSAVPETGREASPPQKDQP